MNKINYIFAAVLSSVLFLSGCGSGCNSGDGKKIGRVVKIAKHGVFCTTYEGEIIRGGFNGGDGVNGNSLHFSIKSQKLVDALTKAMENQEEIELSYKHQVLSGPCYGNSDYIATDFKVLKKKNVELKQEEKPVTVIQFEDDSL